ncbi:MAG: metallophosphoesterase family protein [Candidatus Krumholzibacteriia bacterium]
MRHLLFSDIHGNLEALQAVLKSAATKDIDSMCCLGDFVGYGANPNEVVHAVAELPNCGAVLGNHDAAVIDSSEGAFFNPVARAGVIYSQEHVDEQGTSYLKDLGLVIDSNEDFLLVHASPADPGEWIYVLEPLEAADAFHAMKHPLAFIGHTHFPAVHSETGSVSPFRPGERLKVSPEKRLIINVGSVGQPRDGDCRAAYVVYDDESKSVEMFRVDYDIDTAARKILDAGLPPMLADRIRRGY